MNIEGDSYKCLPVDLKNRKCFRGPNVHFYIVDFIIKIISQSVL